MSQKYIFFEKNNNIIFKPGLYISTLTDVAGGEFSTAIVTYTQTPVATSILLLLIKKCSQTDQCCDPQL